MARRIHEFLGGRLSRFTKLPHPASCNHPGSASLARRRRHLRITTQLRRYLPDHLYTDTPLTAAVEGMIRAFHEQMFDASMELKTLLVEGDRAAAIEGTLLRRHTGEFAGTALYRPPAARAI